MCSLNKIYNEYLEIVKNDVDLERFHNYVIIHHSNSIEGSTLSLDETIILLDEGLTPKNKPVEHTLMALDHLKALLFTIELGKERQKLTIDLIKNISGILQKNTGKIINTILGTVDTTKGDFRTVRAKAGVSTFKAEGIKEKVESLVEDINSRIDQVCSFEEINELAFDAHLILVSIHPFSDGNGRTSRLIMNYIQQYHNLPLSIVFEEDKSDYYQALIKARELEDPQIFRDFMFNQTKKLLLDEISKNKKKQTVKKIKGMHFVF
jgi:Fic family protein